MWCAHSLDPNLSCRCEAKPDTRRAGDEHARLVADGLPPLVACGLTLNTQARDLHKSPAGWLLVGSSPPKSEREEWRVGWVGWEGGISPVVGSALGAT